MPGPGSRNDRRHETKKPQAGPIGNLLACAFRGSVLEAQRGLNRFFRSGSVLLCEAYGAAVGRGGALGGLAQESTGTTEGSVLDRIDTVVELGSQA